jgi:putative addiction module component (TIGR02574 family)
MDHTTKALTREALELPLEERLALVDALLASLQPADPSIAAAWADESEDRLEAFLRGELRAVPADEVLAKHLQR